MNMLVRTYARMCNVVYKNADENVHKCTCVHIRAILCCVDIKRKDLK